MPWQPLTFAAGVFLLQQSAVLPPSTFLVALGGLSVFAWLVGGRRMPVIALLAAAGLGFAWAGGWAHWRLADVLPAEREGQDVVVTGNVVDMPQRFERGLRFTFAVEQAEAPVPSRIALSWYRQQEKQEWQGDDDSGEEVAVPGMLPIPRAGERWRLLVRLKRPHGSVNPHGFDYEGWLFERGIRATGHVRKSADNARLEREAAGPMAAIGRWRENMRHRLLQAMPEQPYVGVLVALAIGDQQAIAPELWRLFASTGITHLMSISGLHVTMFGGLAAWLAAWLWRRSAHLPLLWPAQKVAAVAAFCGACAYALLAGFGVPAQRTLYMLGVVVAALLSGRAVAASRVLGTALLLVLLVDPWAVLAAGFWLSFAAVALLFFIAGRAAAKPHWLAGWARAQWAMTLGMIPLLLALFQQFSLVSPLANALAIPLVSLLVTPLALLGSLPGMTWGLHAAHAVLVPLMDWLTWLAGLPGALWQQHAPPPWAVPPAVLGCLWLLLPRGFPSRWLGIVLLLPLFLVFPERPAPGAMRVMVMDVGQGQAVHVQTAQHDLLYDTGPDFGGAADAGNRLLVPYLRAMGVGRLDRLVVSHADRDHAGGMDSILAALPVDALVTSIEKSTPAPRQATRRCSDGESWEWDGVRFRILHPTGDDYDRKRPTNAMSCVLKIESRHGSALIPGDLEGAAETAFLARHAAEAASDVLVAPHHGGRHTSSPDFVAAVAAREVIFSAGYRNRFGHPWPAIEERYRNAGARLHRTDRDGTVTVTLDRELLAPQHERERRQRYWFAR